MISQHCTTMDWFLDQHSWKQSQLYTLKKRFCQCYVFGTSKRFYTEPFL